MTNLLKMKSRLKIPLTMHWNTHQCISFHKTPWIICASSSNSMFIRLSMLLYIFSFSLWGRDSNNFPHESYKTLGYCFSILHMGKVMQPLQFSLPDLCENSLKNLSLYAVSHLISHYRPPSHKRGKYFNTSSLPTRM